MDGGSGCSFGSVAIGSGGNLVLFNRTDLPRRRVAATRRDCMLENVAAPRSGTRRVRTSFAVPGTHDIASCLLALVYFCLNAESTGSAFVLPTPSSRLWMAIPRNGCCRHALYIGHRMVLLGQHSDRNHGRNGPCRGGGEGRGSASDCRAGVQSVIVLALLCFAQIGVSAVPAMFLAVPASFLNGASAAAGIAAIKNSLGNLSAPSPVPFAMGYLQDLHGQLHRRPLLLAGMRRRRRCRVMSLRIDVQAETIIGSGRAGD